MRSLLYSVLFFCSASSFVYSQCANSTTMLFEDFEGASPIQGAVTTNIYGGGSWTNASYILNGNAHGWFNVINGIGNVDVYDRHIIGFCADSIVNVSLWTRESYGGTNVTFSVEDDLGVVLASSTIILTSVFQQVNFSFPATTPGLHMIIHCNSTGGNGIDIVVEDILITHCYSVNTEDVLYTDCNLQSTMDLYSLFTNIPIGGSWSGPSSLGNGYLGTFNPTINVSGTYSYTDNSSCVPSISTVEINVPGDIDLGPDTTVCTGTWVSLDAGAGFDTYTWSHGPTSQVTSVLQPGTYSIEVGTIMDNIVLNGDFEGGTTAAANNFTTGYIPGTGGTWGLLSNGGQYAVANNPNATHTNFVVCGDHTTGSGNMFVANGSWIAGTIAWSQTVTVNPNTDYMFSFWATNVVNNPNTSDLQLYVNGTAIGPINSTTTACNWGQIADIWNSGANTTATLSIVNQSTVASGNDFALDDISFAPICIKTDTIVVSTEIPSQNITTVDPVCFGDLNGEIHVDNPLAVEFSFDGGGSWQVDSFMINLPAGTYNVCSRSALGCAICNNVTIVDPSQVTLAVSPDTTICENGSAILLASGSGGTSFTYHWNFTANNGAQQTVSPAVETIYYVYAENELGCLSNIDSVEVALFPPLDGTLSTSITICPGDQVTLVGTASGGIGAPYSFEWSNGTTNLSPGTDQITIVPSTTSTYSLTITDGCESIPFNLNSTVNVAPLPVPQYQVLSEDQCEPGVFILQNTTDPSMTQFVTWIVNGEEVFVNEETITTQEYLAGSYDLQMIVTSYNGCVDSMTFYDALIVYPSPTANFTFSPSPVTMFNTNVLFNNGSIGAAYYQWFFEEGEPATSTNQHPSTTFPDGEVGTYEVILIVESDLGCFDTIIQEVQVYPEVILYAPNTFTPDGDEHNQVWRVFIEGIDSYDFELTIFNRWGQQVWVSRDPESGWDATYNGYEVQDGTYSWVIQARDLLNDGKYIFNGHVNVIR